MSMEMYACIYLVRKEIVLELKDFLGVVMHFAESNLIEGAVALQVVGIASHGLGEDLLGQGRVFVAQVAEVVGGAKE